MINQFLNTFALVCCLASAGFAIYLYFVNRSSLVNKYLARAVFFTAIWSSCFLIVPLLSNAFFVRLAFALGGQITSSLALFVWVFIYEKMSWRRAAFFTFSSLVVSLLILDLIFPHFFFRDLEVVNGEIKKGVFGPGMIVNFLYLVACCTYIFVLIYRAFKTLTGLKLLQLKYITIGIIVGLSVTTVLFLILPALGIYGYNFMGPILSLILAVSMMYAATKHHIWEARVVLSEVWALLLVTVIFSLLWLNRNPLNLTVFMMASVVSVLLIRSVLSESKINVELKNRNEELEKDKTELKKLEESTGQFLEIAHRELTLPVSVIEKELTIITKDDANKFDEKQRKELEPVLAATTRLSHLIKNFFDASFIEHGKYLIVKSPTNMKELIKRAVLSLEERAEKRNLKIETEGLDDNLPKLLVDQAKIYDVCYYLVENAIKFTTRGSITVSVKIVSNSFSVSIKDTGVGISAEDQKKLFTKFFQPSKSHEQLPQEQIGIGLGLYISKNIIETHGGKIWVESREGEGSTFSFSLPVGQRFAP